jgi:hypothetical protein
VLFDWWIERVQEIRGLPETVEPTRLDEMRSELCDRVTTLCRKEGASLEQTPDSVLQEGLRKELETILELRRLYRPPTESAA